MISIIIPVHNEANILAETIALVRKAAAGLGDEFEIIIAEDGRTDGTPDAAREIESKSPGVRVLATRTRAGRGASLSSAMRAARGDIIVYMDADLATGLEYLPPLVGEVAEGGSDIATGSRLMAGSKVRGRGFLREVSSRAYNLMLRALFGSKIRDHQCGFKAFRRSSVLPILEMVKDKHWFWDSELLILAQRKGLKVAELPVSWTDRKESRVRLHSDILYMGMAAVRLRLRI